MDDNYWFGFFVGIGCSVVGLLLGLWMSDGPTLRHDSPIRPDLSITVDVRTGIADTTYIYRKP